MSAVGITIMLGLLCAHVAWARDGIIKAIDRLTVAIKEHKDRVK